MDVLVSSSSVYSCLQRRALGVAMLAPPPVTPHLPLLTPESSFLMWAAYPKTTAGWESFLTGTSDGANPIFPTHRFALGYIQHVPHILLLKVSTTLQVTAGEGKQFDSFTKKTFDLFSASFLHSLFCFNNKGDILRPLELLQSLSTLSYFNYSLK